MTNIIEWMVDWFQRRGASPPANTEEQLRLNYFDAGLLDSLSVIELIIAVERHFGIHFNHEHFQDRRFSTIGGLADMIEELRRAG